MTAAAVAVLCGILATSTTATAAPATIAADPVRVLVGMRPGHGLASAATEVDGVAVRPGRVAGAGVLTVEGDRAASVLASLRRSRHVAWAELDHRAEAADVIPNDPQWPYQWGHSKIGAPRAWETTGGAPTITIAIADTGVRASHPDLLGAVLPGWDFVNNDADADDDNGHGTAVAGVAAARGNNSVDVAGVCWTCSILPVKVLDSAGNGWVSHIADGVVYAADRGAAVINLSLSSTEPSQYLDSAVAYARSKGVVVVAAAGNSGATTLNYPAASPGVLGVAGSDQHDRRYSWSNHGSWVSVAAPGCQRTLKLSGSGDVCGTSLAAPAVAGVAALLRAVNPVASGAQVETAITSTAAPVDYVGNGRVDAAAGVATSATLPPPTTAPGAPTGVTATAGDASATVSWVSPASDGGSAITGYTVTASPGGATTTASGDARSATIPALANGTAYTFTVSATNAVGSGPASEPSAAVTPQRPVVVPGPPSGVRATPEPAAAIVRWNAPADDGGSEITGYTVAASPGGRTITVGGNARSVVVDDLDNGTAHRFTVRATNVAGTGPASDESTAVTPSLVEVPRASGSSRVATAVAVSRRAFDAAGTVVIARADAYADALAAAPLAAKHGAPVLLTPSTSLPSDVRGEVVRLGAATAILVGGTAAIAPSVEDALRAAGVSTVRRVAGQNRFDTAALIARQVGGTSVVVVEGANADPRRGWPDAVAASAHAASSGQPILLVTREGVPSETADALRDLAPDRAVVVGGSAAVPDAVATALGVPWSRLAGNDRYATSVAVAGAASAGTTVRSVWLATGRDWPDALAAGPAAAARGGVLLLVDGADTSGSAAVTTWLEGQRARLGEAVVVGGSGSISDTVHLAIADLLI